MPLNIISQALPGLENIKFEDLNGKHFIILLLFLFFFNIVHFAYKIYKDRFDNKKLGAIYRFIENQEKLNTNWDQYIKSLTERFIREAPPDQIKIILKLLVDNMLKRIMNRTKIILELNGIKNRDSTEVRIRMYIKTTFEDAAINFDLFMYQGNKLGIFLNMKWQEIIAKKVIESLYGGENLNYLSREFYDIGKQIKLDFYCRMVGKINKNEK